MDNMDDIFDDILFTQSDMESADNSKLLINNPNIFDEDIDVDLPIAELMHISPEIFDVSVLICFNRNNNTYTTNKLTSFIKISHKINKNIH